MRGGAAHRCEVMSGLHPPMDQPQAPGRLTICRPFADQNVGRGAPGLGCRGMTRADFRYKMGLVGAVRDQAGQAAALS